MFHLRIDMDDEAEDGSLLIPSHVIAVNEDPNETAAALRRELQQVFNEYDAEVLSNDRYLKAGEPGAWFSAHVHLGEGTVVRYTLEEHDA